MQINTDINLIGGLSDWGLIQVFLEKTLHETGIEGGIHSFTTIKTEKSVRKFERAILATFLKYPTKDIEVLIRNLLIKENLSQDSLLLMFWNASFNNELLNYLNTQIYFASFFSGRVSIKQDEVVACLKDLKEREIDLKRWSDSTLQITSSKYLTLLKKFNLMVGSLNKTIVHPYLNDKMFIHFVYWITAIETKSNLLQSKWLQYSFCERSLFVERVHHKKYSKYFQFTFTGDRLKIETLIPYEKISDAIK